MRRLVAFGLVVGVLSSGIALSATQVGDASAQDHSSEESLYLGMVVGYVSVLEESVADLVFLKDNYDSGTDWKLNVYGDTAVVWFTVALADDSLPSAPGSLADVDEQYRELMSLMADHAITYQEAVKDSDESFLRGHDAILDRIKSRLGELSRKLVDMGVKESVRPLEQ